MPGLVKGTIIGFFFLLCSVAWADKFQFPDFVADTLVIPFSIDSSQSDSKSLLTVVDKRENFGIFLGIEEIKRWQIIPVDQYLVLEESLSVFLGKYLTSEIGLFEQSLVIDNLTIWEDSRPLFLKGRVLNGYSLLVNNDGRIIKDWQWEFRIKKIKKEKKETEIGRLLINWMEAQKSALRISSVTGTIFPFRYRRQFVLWMDWIFFQDGYIVDGRLSLDFPTDQMDSYIRSVPGIYYRKSSLHESIAIGGKDQQLYKRFNQNWIGRLDFTFRIGANSFNPSKFDYLDWWNLLMVNMGFTTSLEYRPVYLKGVFAGIGLHQAINVLPDVISRFETGLLITLGIVLP